MRTRWMIGGGFALVGSLTLCLTLLPRGDDFNALGTSLAPEFAGGHDRTWALAGTEAESRRKVEALLAKERGWRLVGRTSYASDARVPDVMVQYFNDASKDECELGITHPLRGPERIRVRLDRMTLTRYWMHQMGFGPSSTRA